MKSKNEVMNNGINEIDIKNQFSRSDIEQLPLVYAEYVEPHIYAIKNSEKR